MRINQSGFTLVEILVSLVILSVALLGMAGLQILSMQSSTSALNRSQATMVAYDLAERMRRNRLAALNSRYNSEILLINGDQKNAPASPGCIQTGCTSDQLAEQDIREWLENFTDVAGVGLDGDDWRPVLPDGNAILTRSPPSSNKFKLRITWSENNQGQNSVTQPFYAMDFAL